MFGLGMTEILVILALALIIIGPKKLPALAKTLGKAMGEFKNAAQDFKNSINIESSIADMDPPAETIQKNIKQANKELAKNKNKIQDSDFETGSDGSINSDDRTYDSTVEKSDNKSGIDSYNGINKDDIKEGT